MFTTASGLCGLAGSQEMLIGARFVQGVGGAMASAVTLGMIVTMFPEPADQAKAIGVYAFVASAGASILVAFVARRSCLKAEVGRTVEETGWTSTDGHSETVL